MTLSCDYKAEISPSNRALCTQCHHSILKHTLRLKVYEGFNYGHSSYSFVCARCALKFLNNIIDYTDEILKMFERFVKNENRLIQPVKEGKEK